MGTAGTGAGRSRDGEGGALPVGLWPTPSRNLKETFDPAHRSIQNLRFAPQAKLAQASKRSKRPLAS